MATTFDFEKLKSKNPKVKYGFAKELLKTGLENPYLLYDHYDSFSALQKDKNNFLKWTGIDLIGYMSSVDIKNKTVEQIPVLKKLLHGGHLITSNHAILSLGLIAANRPEFIKEVVKELLLVEKDTFKTAECKNIAIGKVIVELGKLHVSIVNNNKAIRFIEKATENKRNSTRKKAVQLLAKLQRTFKEPSL